MKGRTRKRKSCAKFNFYVYARHTTLCLYFITRVKFALRVHVRKRDSGNPPQLEFFVTASAKLVILLRA